MKTEVTREHIEGIDDWEEYQPVWEAQLLSYLKLTGKRLGYILNFNVPLMKDGIKRMIL